MPVGNVLVCDAGRHIEHDDAALAVDVVTITETTELLLTSSIPDIELDGAEVLWEREKKTLVVAVYDVMNNSRGRRAGSM